MKTKLIIASVTATLIAAAALGLHLATPAPEVRALAENAAPRPNQVRTDPAEVFRRAFWQHPGKDDHILHAERREWPGAEGLQKWQWHLIVRPSPELLHRLRTENVFALAPTTTLPPFPDAPTWFHPKPEGAEILHSRQGSMTLIYHPTDGTLHATDSAAGFTKKTNTPLKPHTTAASLPTAPRREQR